MSVMTPEQLRQGRVGQPPMLQQNELQRQAVIDQLGAPPAQLSAAGPVAKNPGIFARGGQVKQLPTADLVGMGTKLAASTGTQMAGKLAGNTAAGAAVGSGINVAAGLAADKVRRKEDTPVFGGPNAEYLDDYGRRFQGTGGGTAAGAIRGAGYGANPGLVAATGGLSIVGGAAIGAAIAAAKRHAASAFTDFRVEDAAEAIQNAYRKELGREASDEEVMTHLQNTGFDPTGGDRWSGEKPTNYILNTIRDSPESQTFKAGGAQRQAVMDQLGEATPETSVPAGAVRESGAAGAAPAGQGGRLEGFDADKLASGHDSPKYQVARVLQKYPSTPAGLQAALAEINALGIGTASIGGSKGDKLSFGGNVDPRFNGITTFDVIRGAGNGGEAWTWQPEGGTAPVPTAAPSQGGLIDSTGRTFENGGVLGDPDVMARIRAELQRIVSGEPDREALMAQMGAA